ncbi:MAG: hypothetical protein LBH29_00450 [Elusimicrobiota bacterium]|jgi:hypothetical protein|nr:hypothetical protein [Elusimicrobiota bacterium]
MKLTIDEKLSLMKSVNWDYDVCPKDMLDVIERRRDSAGVFDRKQLFVRCLERLRWYDIISLYGIEQMTELYTPEISRRIRKELRREYDFAFAFLRGEPLSFTGWGDSGYKPLPNPFLPDRWYRLK